MLCLEISPTSRQWVAPRSAYVFRHRNALSAPFFINQKSQGQGIGRIAYQKACKESKYLEIYASMKKSNIASIRAAFAAGFKIVPSASNQVVMLWPK